MSPVLGVLRATGQPANHTLRNGYAVGGNGGFIGQLMQRNVLFITDTKDRHIRANFLIKLKRDHSYDESRAVRNVAQAVERSVDYKE